MQLLPEMVGLAITPAAIVATLVLLGSSHPWRNVALFGGAFLVVYSVIAGIAWAVGSGSGPSEDANGTVRGWVSLVLGLLFLAGAVVPWLRSRSSPHPASAEGPPAWVQRLADPPWRLVAGAGLVLSLLNPNVAILASGLGIVLTADVTHAQRLVGTGLLLASSMADFVVPSALFAISGVGGRERLRHATQWLVAHNRQIGNGVLVFFGVLFASRGVAVLLG